MFFLQSLTLKVFERGQYEQPHTKALQQALQALKSLTCLKLTFYWTQPWDSRANIDSAGFSKAAAKLTRLRCALPEFSTQEHSVVVDRAFIAATSQ